MGVDLGYYPYHVKYKGLVDLLGLYKMIKKWFDDRGFYFEEKMYKYRPGEGMGARIQINVQGWIKMTDYIKHQIELEIYVFDVQEVPVEKDGQKETWYSCRLYVNIDGKIEADWEGRWETSESKEGLRKFHNRFLFYHDFLLVHWDKLNYKTLILHNEIKKFLGMHTSKAYYDYL